MPSTKSSSSQLRLRVFAGPNGSGKSTVIKAVREAKHEGGPIDFGYYINADDITQDLKLGKFGFRKFDLKVKQESFRQFAIDSGLLGGDFALEKFDAAFEIAKNSLNLLVPEAAEKIGQIIARFLRAEMLRLKKRFSFETVFSHGSNLDIMRRAAEAGYKVYLYFVSTESAEINKYRVKLRVQQGGHDVPADKIQARYYRSLDLMYPAAQIAYQAFFFDNSKDNSDGNSPYELVAHFKKTGDRKVWDEIDSSTMTGWFKTYYSDKVEKNKNKGQRKKSKH